MSTWSRPCLMFLSFFFTLLLMTGCDLNTLAETQPQKVETLAGEYGWFYIDELVGTTCDHFKACGLVENFSACTATVLSSQDLPETLGAEPTHYPRTYELREGERTHSLRVNEEALDACLTAVEATDCATLNTSPKTNPETWALEILTIESSCQFVYY